MPEPGATTPDLSRSLAMSARLADLGAGGAHTYAKGDDQFPERLAPILVRGDGCHTWDADGNGYIEYGMGLRSVTLGHGYRPVVDAVRQQLEFGVNLGRPTELELRAAEEFLALIDTADMVNSRKTGRMRQRPRCASLARPPAATWWRSAPTSRSSPPTTGLSGRPQWRPEFLRRYGI